MKLCSSVSIADARRCEGPSRAPHPPPRLPRSSPTETPPRAARSVPRVCARARLLALEPFHRKGGGLVKSPLYFFLDRSRSLSLSLDPSRSLFAFFFLPPRFSCSNSLASSRLHSLSSKNPRACGSKSLVKATSNTFVTNKVCFKSICRGQPLHKSVNLSFKITNLQNTLADVYED